MTSVIGANLMAAAMAGGTYAIVGDDWPDPTESGYAYNVMSNERAFYSQHERGLTRAQRQAKRAKRRKANKRARKQRKSNP
jgi:hypothetical protein